MKSKSTSIYEVPMSPASWRMKLANKLRWHKGMTQSEAMTVAWQCRDMLDLLRMGVVNFAYIKDNGEYRRARGTLKAGISPEFDAWMNHHNTSGYDSKSRNENTDGTYNYWDLDKNGFRSFHADKLVDLDIEL